MGQATLAPTARIGLPGLVLALLFSLTSGAGTARGQPGGDPPRTLASLGVDTTSLATGPYATMQGLLERTFLKVDVATATIQVGTGVASRLRSLVEARGRDGAPRDSLAGAVIHATDAFVRIRFHRHVAPGRFISELRKDVGRARDAGIIGPAEYDTVSAGLPRWYAFLEDRGVRDGDEMIYRIRGDTLRTLYLSGAGDVMMDQVDVGAFRRLSVLGGYLAPGTSFREPLLRSLPSPEASAPRRTEAAGSSGEEDGSSGEEARNTAPLGLVLLTGRGPTVDAGRAGLLSDHEPAFQG